MDKAVIFDMDGVIVHTNPYHSKAFQRFFAKRDLHPTEQEFAEHMYGKSNSYIMSHFLGRKIEGEELLELEREKEGLFRDIYRSQIDPINGFTSFFQQLKGSGWKTAVATSAPHANLTMIIEHIGIAEQMGSMMASEDVIHHKPDPEVYLTSASKLGLDPTCCIVFEDSFSGVSAGIAAGMKVVGVLSSHTIDQLPPCDHYISDYLDIKPNLLSLLLNQ